MLPTALSLSVELLSYCINREKATDIKYVDTLYAGEQPDQSLFVRVPVRSLVLKILKRRCNEMLSAGRVGPTQ